MREIFAQTQLLGMDNLNERHQKQEARVAKMTFTIVGVFVFCNAFESIVWILASLGNLSLDVVQDYLRPLADLLMTINSSINICIYSYFNKQFKEKFWDMYLQWFCKKEEKSVVIKIPGQGTTATKGIDHSIEMKSITTKNIEVSNNSSSDSADISVDPKPARYTVRK